MYRLIVTDLDGTLLNAAHRIGQRTRAVLTQLRAQGIEILLASGRHFRDVQHLAGQLDGHGCLISSNGAAVHDRGGRLLQCHPLGADLVEFLIRDPRLAGVHVNLYRIADWLVAAPNPDLLRYHQSSGFAYRIQDLTERDDQPVLKVFYHHQDARLLTQLEQHISAQLGASVATTYSLPTVLEVMAPGVSKGTALQAILRQRGVAREQVLAFGDGRNDLELLQLAGTGLIMANADPHLTAALPHLATIGHHADEAVAAYLETHLLGST